MRQGGAVNFLRLAVIAAVAVLIAGVGSYVVWNSASADDAEGRADVDVSALPASEVVGEWDRQRAAAWAEGDVRALAALYTTASGAGDTDLEMLGQYVDRGLVVEGLTTQLLEVEQVRRTPDTLVVHVTDRVQGGTVVGEGVRHALPRDQPTTRVVEFRLVERGWVVARVDEPGQPRAAQERTPVSPALSTSATSESSKS